MTTYQQKLEKLNRMYVGKSVNLLFTGKSGSYRIEGFAESNSHKMLGNLSYCYITLKEVEKPADLTWSDLFHIIETYFNLAILEH